MREHDSLGGHDWPEYRVTDSSAERTGWYRDRYRVLGLLAEGGMARIYSARDMQVGRDVALKELAPTMARDPVRAERFRLEARRIAALVHPRIVPLLDFGEENGRLFLVMPLYPSTLRRLLDERRTLDFATALHFLSQVADALDFAHSQGLVHCDVKPENVLLDGNGNALLTDFGISRTVSTASNTLATSAPLRQAEAGRSPMVSIEYSSPEQLINRPLDARADIYGLGVLAYEILTGRLPHEYDGQVYSLLLHVLESAPVPPSQVSPRPLPPAADAAILKALDRNPALRFERAGDFVAALAVRPSRLIARPAHAAAAPTPEKPSKQRPPAQRPRKPADGVPPLLPDTGRGGLLSRFRRRAR